MSEIDRRSRTNESLHKTTKANVNKSAKSRSTSYTASAKKENGYSSNLEEQFKAACDAIQNLPKNGPFQPSNEMLLKFYAYFKQATQGDCKTSKPSIFKVVERAKWDAW